MSMTWTTLTSLSFLFTRVWRQDWSPVSSSESPHNRPFSFQEVSRVGMPDYLVVFRKPGDPVAPVARPNGFNPQAYIGEDGADCKTSIDVWQRYASPVWSDINQTNVLNVRVARAEKDERT